MSLRTPARSIALALVATALAWPTARAELWEDGHHPPPLRLRVSRDRALTIVNRSRFDVELAWTVEVEQLLEGATRTWIDRSAASPTNLGSMRLIASCSEAVEGTCRTVRPRESLRVVPWSGLTAAPQCPIRTPSEISAPTGRYRYVIRVCGSDWRLESPPFTNVSTED
jgi:hypothetical protein